MAYSTRSPQSVRAYDFETGDIKTLFYGSVTCVSGFVIENVLYLYCLFSDGVMKLMTFGSLTASPDIYDVDTAQDGIRMFSCAKIGIRYYMSIQNQDGVSLICAHDDVFKDRGLSRVVTTNDADKTYSDPDIGYEQLHVSPDGHISDITVCVQRNETTGPSVAFYSVPIDLR